MNRRWCWRYQRPTTIMDDMHDMDDTTSYNPIVGAIYTENRWRRTHPAGATHDAHKMSCVCVVLFVLTNKFPLIDPYWIFAQRFVTVGGQTGGAQTERDRTPTYRNPNELPSKRSIETSHETTAKQHLWYNEPTQPRADSRKSVSWLFFAHVDVRVWSVGRSAVWRRQLRVAWRWHRIDWGRTWMGRAGVRYRPVSVIA